MMNYTVLEWFGSLIPLKLLYKHHNRSVCCGHTIVSNLHGRNPFFCKFSVLLYFLKRLNIMWKLWKDKCRKLLHRQISQKVKLAWTARVSLYAHKQQGDQGGGRKCGLLDLKTVDPSSLITVCNISTTQYTPYTHS